MPAFGGNLIAAFIEENIRVAVHRSQRGAHIVRDAVGKRFQVADSRLKLGGPFGDGLLKNFRGCLPGGHILGYPKHSMGTIVKRAPGESDPADVPSRGSYAELMEEVGPVTLGGLPRVAKGFAVGWMDPIEQLLIRNRGVGLEPEMRSELIRAAESLGYQVQFPNSQLS